MVVAIDFDGTCVTHAYPQVGDDIGAAPWLKKFVKAGAKLILYTMRDDATLEDAEQWFEDNGIKLWASQKHPYQSRWTDSPKCHADLCIDDRDFGCPLTRPVKGSARAHVDWSVVGPAVLRMLEDD